MKPFKYLFFTLFLLYSSLSYAENIRYYDIEIIIFESTDEQAKISENWPHEVIMQTPPLVVELGQPYPGPLPKQFDPKQTFRLTASNKLQLLEEAKLLTESKNYRILLHTGWRQPGMDVDSALPVHINQSFLVDEAARTQSATTPVTLAAVNPAQTRSVLNGYIKVILSRYLHMDVKLAYTTKIPLSTETVIPAKQLDDAEGIPLALPKPVVYFLDETRKMRSKEVHYIDSPVLGVVVLATPSDNSDQ